MSPFDEEADEVEGLLPSDDMPDDEKIAWWALRMREDRMQDDGLTPWEKLPEEGRPSRDDYVEMWLTMTR